MPHINWPTAIVAACLPLLGIVCSRISFSFGEDGAVPDEWNDPGRYREVGSELLVRGMRYRARISARALFDIGALLVVAGIVMGISDAHDLGLLAPTSIAAYLVVAFAAAYGGRTVLALWNDRRQNAFDAFYSREASWLYKQEDAIRDLYFEMNPMRFPTIFRRNWTPTIRRPSADESLAANNAAGGNPPVGDATPPEYLPDQNAVLE